MLQGAIDVQVEDQTFGLMPSGTFTSGAIQQHSWLATDDARILRALVPGVPDPQISKR